MNDVLDPQAPPAPPAPPGVPAASTPAGDGASLLADIYAEMAAVGVEGEAADVAIAGFVDHYTTVTEFNRLADSTGLMERHPDSNDQRETLASVLAAEIASLAETVDGG